MSHRTNPRASDVARWVRILARPFPKWIAGAALIEERRERSRAHHRLASWGLDDEGNPRAPAPVDGPCEKVEQT